VLDGEQHRILAIEEDRVLAHARARVSRWSVPALPARRDHGEGAEAIDLGEERLGTLSGMAKPDLVARPVFTPARDVEHREQVGDCVVCRVEVSRLGLGEGLADARLALR
jgi:hypothetical protein